MPPPPVPIDPAIDTWRPTTTAISPTLGLDNLLQSLPAPPARWNHSSLSNLDSLSLSQEVQLPAMRHAPTEPDPLLRFYNDQGPWNSQQIGGDPGHTHMNPQFPSFESQMPRDVHPMLYHYRSPRSEVGSSTTGRYPFDSGYGGSKSFATKSVRSADQVDQSPSRRSAGGEIRDHHSYHGDSYQDLSPRSIASPNTQYSSMDPVSDDLPQPPMVTFDLTCQYTNCGATSKNHSEHRKHLLRHEKPYKCIIPGCSKVDGFSTNNDLDRHKKSVHKIMPKNSSDRSFRCAAINCPKKEKIWPRLDNFRQHCLRIHHEEDCDELVKKSELDPGLAIEANDLANSSNHEAGDTQPGADVGELSDYLNPSITFDPHLNILPIQCGVESHMPQAQHFRPLSPHSPDTPSNVAHNASAVQQPVASQLLQVPGAYSPGKRPQSPSWKPFRIQDEGNISHTLGDPRKRVIKSSKPLASTRKAEQISEELASEIAKCIDLSRGPPEDIQAAIKNRVLLALNPNLSRKRSAQMAQLRDENGHRGAKKIKCDQCSVTTARQCDMKKHQKRHTRPYGCTFPGCSKKLGSKNDWKRHENTQHYQIETWRCHEDSESSAIGQCASLFYRREQFQSHLRDKHHKHDEQYIQDQCKVRRIGRNGQGRFWCGFCQQIVELKKKGLEAWEERFGHIDDLHYKKGQTIFDWVPLDGHVPKGLMGKGDYMDCGVRNEEKDEGGEDDGSSEDEAIRPLSETSKSNTPSPRSGGAEGKSYAACDSHVSSGGHVRATRQATMWKCVSG
ncbi:MAG: hypothetical protein Q9224_004438 [Gallowayella concinna]